MLLLPGAGRFNERMVLSLASNPSCLLLDDELNILPTSSHVKNIEPLPVDTDGTNDASGKDTELKGLSESLSDTLVGHAHPKLTQTSDRPLCNASLTVCVNRLMVCVCVQPAGPLVAKCRTLDQARAVMTFLDAASEKTLRSTVALTAARGRGKVHHQHTSHVSAIDTCCFMTLLVL